MHKDLQAGIGKGSEQRRGERVGAGEKSLIVFPGNHLSFQSRAVSATKPP
jgi:hypothetical protein